MHCSYDYDGGVSSFYYWYYSYWASNHGYSSRHYSATLFISLGMTQISSRPLAAIYHGIDCASESNPHFHG